MEKDVNDNLQAQTDDPIVGKSLSGPMLIATLVLIGTLLWALYDEVYGSRPWKAVQREFVTRYTAYLRTVKPRQAGSEDQLKQSETYRKLEQDVQAAKQAVDVRVKQIDDEVRQIEHQLGTITPVFQDARAKIGALTYEWEQASSEGSKNSIKRDIDEAKQRLYEVELPDGSGKIQTLRIGFDDLQQRFSVGREQKAKLMAELAELKRPVAEAERKLEDYKADNLVGLNQKQIDDLIKKMQNFNIEIKQIDINQGEWVDRCTSCHLGILEPMPIRARDMGRNGAVFVSHPNPALLKIHNPERFGCSPCHNGNGRATTSVEKAHGTYKHWLWPLYPKRDGGIEAGCVQCHFKDRVLDGAPTFNLGRDLFEYKGCFACHRYEGYDRETDALTTARQTIRQLEMETVNNRREMVRATKEADQASDNTEARRLYALAESLRVRNSQIADQLEQVDLQAKFLMQDQKKVGPNLKEIRLKLRKDWVPVWVENPHAFRPTTKMPRFRLEPDEVRALSAYLWQNGLEDKIPAQQMGDAVRGRDLFETRGCLACHSIGEGDQMIGGTFAANLSRVGEKANFDYLVRWIHNPRERTRPYCAFEKRDIGPEDYAKKGQPFVFDLDHSKCPSCGHELQVQQMTVMPSLRLSQTDARDIATYLVGQRQNNAQYQAASFMDDPQVAQRGATLIRRYGCASCHEIRGFEEEPRIATELTQEGSKPKEQLDFALLEHDAKKDGWYTHRGFFEHKMQDPASFDHGKMKAPEDRLRMPNPNVTPQEIKAIATFLEGSVKPTLPQRYYFTPLDQRRDIQEGWWVIKKYNCMGCHAVQIGQRATLSSVPRYQDPDWKDQLPPSLIGQGARVNPDWLINFLKNPALSETDTERNGVRTYLRARMPTFNFSPNELRLLVRFFSALSAQPTPYIPTKLEPLTEQERTLARALFTSQGAPCLKCHLTGDPGHDRTATAPNFLQARERLKPGWTSRWLLDPAAISPGTAMPSGLFKRDADRWVFSGPVPEGFKSYGKDHVDLLVRYMFQLSADEQRRLVGSNRTSSGTTVAGQKTNRPRPASTSAAGSGGR
jgi:cytochrome c2